MLRRNFIMTQTEASAGRAEKLSSLNPASQAFAAMTKKRFEELAEVQSTLLEELRDANQNWLARMQSEATLASEFTSKLAGSHSVADTTTACQEWAKQRMELLTEDGKQLMINSQKFMEKTAQVLSNGWLSNGRTGGGPQ
jgi:hypothetical protein